MSKERNASDDLYRKAILLSNKIDEELPDMEKLEMLRVKMNKRMSIPPYARPDGLDALRFIIIFNVSLWDYWDALTGFNIIGFNDFLKVPDGTSTRHFLEHSYGSEAMVLIERLINLPRRGE